MKLNLRKPITVSAAILMGSTALAWGQAGTTGTGSGGGGGGNVTITGPLGPTTAPSAAVATTDTGTPITGQTIPTGGQGLTGWLSAIYSAVTGPTPAGTNSIGSIGNTGFAVTGPLGSATAPNAGVSSNLPDEVNACTGGNTCSVTSAATLATVDMTGYASATITVTANASANTISFTSSDDNTNFVAAPGFNISVANGSPGTTTATAAVLAFSFPKKQRYLRAAVTTFVSGTTTITFQLHQNAPVNVISNPGISAGTSAVGKVGPGFTSSQTPVSISANGTTAAVTATMAAVSGKTNWMCGFSVRAAATAATTGAVTITGILGGTMTFEEYISPIATGMTPVEPPLGHVCISGSATNTAIVLTAPAPGSGGINSANIWGYVE